MGLSCEAPGTFPESRSRSNNASISCVSAVFPFLGTALFPFLGCRATSILAVVVGREFPVLLKCEVPPVLCPYYWPWLEGRGLFCTPSINLGSLCGSGHALLGPLVHSLQILFPFGHFGGRHKCNPLLTCGLSGGKFFFQAVSGRAAGRICSAC
jgi:hypothetical protein